MENVFVILRNTLLHLFCFISALDDLMYPVLLEVARHDDIILQAWGEPCYAVYHDKIAVETSPKEW